MSRLPAALEARIAELIAANEALVLSSLRMQEEADASAEALRTMASSAGQQAVDREYHYTQLRDANEKLVVAALDARTLLDAAELARRRHTDFLAVLAHELRTPLTPIRMAASMLDEVHTVDFPRMKAIIERQVLHITRLLVDVLEVSRAGTGKMRLNTEVLDISGIVDQAIDTCVPAMDGRKQRLSASLPSAPMMIRGDPVRLVQVLVNLLDNASKYTPEAGHIQLTVASAGGELIVTVADSGIGMAAGTLGSMFEPFVQDPKAVAFHGGGLGIGLTVVRELVEAHGGKVSARSDGVGAGSQFTVSLPLGQTR